MVVVCLVVGVLVLVVVRQFRRVEEKARQSAMAMELRNIRIAVQLYHLLNRRYPWNLKDLLTEHYIFPDEQVEIEIGGRQISSGDLFVRKYLQVNAVDDEGYPLDPYGRRYEYDPYKGTVGAAAVRTR